MWVSRQSEIERNPVAVRVYIMRAVKVIRANYSAAINKGLRSASVESHCKVERSTAGEQSPRTGKDVQCAVPFAKQLKALYVAV